MDAVKVVAGMLLVAFSVAVVGQTGVAIRVPLSTVALGAIGLSAAALLVGSVTA